MSTVAVYPHVVKEEGQPARLARSPRVRIAQLVMDFLWRGWSPEEMCRQYPHLSPAEAYAAMAYYFDHKAEIDGEIEAEKRAIDESYGDRTPTGLERRLRADGLL